MFNTADTDKDGKIGYEVNFNFEKFVTFHIFIGFPDDDNEPQDVKPTLVQLDTVKVL